MLGAERGEVGGKVRGVVYLFVPARGAPSGGGIVQHETALLGRVITNDVLADFICIILSLK